MIDILNQSLMITTFVFVMMLVIDYLNVLTRGQWQEHFARNKWGQYLLAAFLGVLPGCLGPFVIVTMYSHRLLTIGAVVTAMIATSGDEAYVMLALIPRSMPLLMAALFVIGILTGALTDFINNRRKIPDSEIGHPLKVHPEETCHCFPQGQILRQWREITPFRALLSCGLLIAAVIIALGLLGPTEWNWVRITLLIVIALAIFIVATVPDHFLEEHVWQHVAKQHLPRIFLWTLGALLVMYLLTQYLDLDNLIRQNIWSVLVVAAFAGIIPESGPHLVFVTLFAEGTIPLSILLTNSIVQDGHGMLPMLAHSRRTFVTIKAINLTIGFLVGAVLLLLGW